MAEMLCEFVDSRGVALRVDRQAGVLRGVKILGLESRNGRSYRPEALAQAAALYEGAKVNVNHPKGGPYAPRDYQDRIGVIRNVAARADGLYGDFHFNPKHALAEQLLWDAEHAPENVGFSHYVEARTARSGERVTVEEIVRVQSVDLVADPATTRGLFEGQPGPCAPGSTSSPQGWNVEELRLHRPDLVDALLCEQNQEMERLRTAIQRLEEAVARLSGPRSVEQHLLLGPPPQDARAFAEAIRRP